MPNIAHSDIAHCKETIATEIEGLQQLHNWMDTSKISEAVELMASAKGRIILSGMGKSGHIGNKIAATLASTGSPSFFVHPGEASHGDMGMITQDDVVILLSNSGETQELKDIIQYATRFSITLIAIVRRKSSILADAANVALVLPNAPEASDVNAPTTSTTMMLALGDALAVALMKRKNFTPDDFGVLHPGGKLGAAFTQVKDLMHTDEEVPTVKEHTIMSDVLIEMTTKRFGCTSVIDQSGVLLGIITDGDLRRHMDNSITTRPASEIMTKGPVTITGNQLASEALAIMQQKKITSLFILENDKPVGILHIHDLLRAGVI